MKALPIPINLIRITADSQSRGATDRRTVEEYAHAWKSEAEFPPVDLFTKDGVYYPGDGIHRIMAAKLAGRPVILAYVYRGDSREAFLHGCASNHAHGLRRTNMDKRHMVTRMLNDVEWVKWSDRRIADQCGVSAQFVANVRHELSTVDGSPARCHADNPRLGADGKMRKPPEPDGGKRPTTDDASARLTAGGANGNLVRTAERRNNHAAQRHEAVVLLEKLQQALVAIHLYDRCAVELNSISDKVRQFGQVEMKPCPIELPQGLMINTTNQPM